ncbi:MAG: thiamine phosphate synthase [Alkalimonas sp.]|nr:thiamine phosphate synthase [Alkalimonas sp.]
MPANPAIIPAIQPLHAMHSTRPKVWSLAASDSGGGAGIQADLLTLHDLGCHACTVLTGITAQNSVALQQLEPVSLHMLEAQLEALNQDLPAQVIKIGMLPDPASIQWLANWLGQYKENHSVFVVADPVLASSSGYQLADDALLDGWRSLLPYIDLLTPNIPELALLTARAEASLTEQVQLVQTLGAQAVLVKGGHAEQLDTIVDRFYGGSLNFSMHSPRLSSPHQHGTGCVLASAISAFLAQGYVLEDALVLARAYIQQSIASGYATGAGPGALGHDGWPRSNQFLPTIRCENWPEAPALPFAALSSELAVYPVVDTVQWLRQLLPLKPGCLQLRIKTGSHTSIELAIMEAIALSKQHGVRLFINDHWKLAIEHGAYGVHLGQQDLLQADLTAIQAAGLRLGLSSHGPFELARALQLQPSYIALGHIFPTQTKQMPSKPQGVKRLADSVSLCGGTPTVAIGGIDQRRFNQVCQTGVNGIAMVSAITKASSPAEALSYFKQQWEQHRAYHR